MTLYIFRALPRGRECARASPSSSPRRRRRFDRSRPRAPLQEVHAKYLPGPLIGKGAYGTVIGCTNKTTQVRYACKSVNVAALLKSRDGANVERRLRTEINIMSYLAGESSKAGLKLRKGLSSMRPSAANCISLAGRHACAHCVQCL